MDKSHNIPLSVLESLEADHQLDQLLKIENSADFPISINMTLANIDGQIEPFYQLEGEDGVPVVGKRYTKDELLGFAWQLLKCANSL